MSEDTAIETKGLGKSYRGGLRRRPFTAVDALDLRVRRGQVFGFLGPNGAGKTTTLRMLMGLIEPDGGEVRIFGHAVRPGAPVLSRVGAFVEGAGFLPHLSGRENLELYWRATGRPGKDAQLQEALEIAGLGDALARAVRTYSQGMRQRLAIAQAMLGLPDLLVLDEPTNGLDPPQIRAMREVLIRYAAAGRTVIVSSHLLAEVEQSCTHLVVMDRGRLVRSGPVGEIVGSGDTLLVGLAADIPDPLLKKVAALPGVRSAARTDGGLLVRLTPPAASPDRASPAPPAADTGHEAGAEAALGGAVAGAAARLVAELVRLEVPVASVGPHRRLEDAFLTLIGSPA
jgi:ABC-2 type transport system ATP-binding protein